MLYVKEVQLTTQVIYQLFQLQLRQKKSHYKKVIFPTTTALSEGPFGIISIPARSGNFKEN